jgi:alkanesulfonate monooxygenase SsuD/methylene tetrahydromethanopterin reductase-like flavin-dependent oxidoreductase (luciferase family)
LARMAADVDRMSGGRLILGVGVGSDADEFSRLGLRMPPIKERLVALEETVLSVQQLWQHGVRPTPLQAPRIPLLIGGGGERRTLRQVARYADAASFVPPNSPGPVDNLTAADVARKSAALEQYCADIGRPFSSVLRTKTAIPVVLAERHSDVSDKLEAIPVQVRTRFQSLMIAGTPDNALRALRPFVTVGLNYFVVFVASNDRETLHLLAQRVLPVLERERQAACSV